MIEINNLKKQFGKLSVLNEFNFIFDKGQITAVVGPNGSGKTTLIKCILGLIKPNSGKISVDSHWLNGDWMYRKSIGYMPQLARFPENLTIHEVIDMIKDLRYYEKDFDDELYLSFNLEQERKKKIRTLSGGTKQKLSAVIAFLFNPNILILDEPTAGLDPRASSQLKDKILKEKARGKTFILTSHIMSELEELSDNIVFMLDGKIRFEGTVQNIMHDTREDKLERAVAYLMENHVE